MATVQSKLPKDYGRIVAEYIKEKQKWLPGGISRSAVVETLNSWGSGGDDQFQYAPDKGLIIPSGKEFMFEPAYIANPEKFPR